MTGGYGVELRNSGDSDKKGVSFCLTKDNTVLRFENIYDFNKGYENGLAGSYAVKGHASPTTDFGVGTTSNYGHCKTINNLTTSSYKNGEALSAYQGYLLKSNADKLLKEYKNSFTENMDVGSEKIHCISFEQPSGDSRDFITYFKAWCSSHMNEFKINAVNLCRFCDKNGIWNLGYILKTRNGISQGENLLGILVDTYANSYNFAYIDTLDQKWVFYNLIDTTIPTGLQIGGGAEYSFTYTNFCVIYAFRNTYYYEAACDTWGNLIDIRKYSSFDVDMSVTASTKTVKIVNNENIAINVLITYPQSLTTITA